jgi:hypothetical protein
MTLNFDQVIAGLATLSTAPPPFSPFLFAPGEDWRERLLALQGREVTVGDSERLLEELQVAVAVGEIEQAAAGALLRTFTLHHLSNHTIGIMVRDLHRGAWSTRTLAGLRARVQARQRDAAWSRRPAAAPSEVFI